MTEMEIHQKRKKEQIELSIALLKTTIAFRLNHFEIVREDGDILVYGIDPIEKTRGKSLNCIEELAALMALGPSVYISVDKNGFPHARIY